MLEEKVRDSIIVALDCDRECALGLADQLEGHVNWLKVGMTLYYQEGPSVVSALRERGFKVFLDLKLHDIPHQVEGAACAAAAAGAQMITVHALGGAAMVAAAREGVHKGSVDGDEPILLAVTVLTSMDAPGLKSIGVKAQSVEDEVSRLALLARGAGADGVVASPREAFGLRRSLGKSAYIVTPGVRPRGTALGDQSRVATPFQALEAGASHLVIGRPITQAVSPVAACEDIVSAILVGNS